VVGGAGASPAVPRRRRGRHGGGVSKAAFIKSALQGMGVTLPKGNEHMLRAHLSRVAQASGRAYLRGLPVPVTEVVGLECQSGVGRFIHSVLCVLAGPVCKK
jgi:hypothetical protein